MESHPCEKTRGEGVPSSITLSPDTTSADPLPETAEAELCRHIDARGHRCRMLVMRPEETLCAHHAQRRLQTQSGNEAAVTELLACATHLDDAESVNRFLATLVRQVTLKRVSRSDAVTLAYICQLLLNSLGAGYREAMFRLQGERLEALAAAKQPPKIIWDLPSPPYERAGPVGPPSQDGRPEENR